VTALDPFTKIDCPSCRAGVRVRRQFDHFMIISQIGVGGMSRVFEAEDMTLGRRVALKILHRNYSRDSARMAQFQNEATITASVIHPNVIKLYTVGSDQGYFYIAMELVGGGSLESLIKKKGKVEEKEALRIGRQVAEGLRAAYRAGLIHRDVKPQNILFTDDGTAKVVDFGLALFANAKDESGEIWATPFYVSPEKVLENQEDFRSDLFSLGASLYHTLTGTPPHQANTNSLTELRMIKSRRVALEDSGLNFGTKTLSAIDTLLAFKPEDRFPSYDAAVEDLRLAEGLADHTVRLNWSHRRKVAAALTVVALAVAFFSGWSLQSLRQPASTTVEAAQLVPEQLAGEGVTLEAGQLSTGERFLEARRTLLEGRVQKAEAKFEAIIRDPLTVQPTLNKARFNAALCNIMAGKQQRSQELIADIGKDASAGDDALAISLFKKLSLHMGNHLGLKVKYAELKDYDLSTEDVLGYLAHGLVQWHLGDPREGARCLETFFKSKSTDPTLEWINQYRVLIAPYRHDIALASTLQKPEMNLSSADAARLLAESEALKSQLKTKGTLQHELDKRIARLKGAVTRTQVVDREKQMREQMDRFKRESTQLAEISSSLPALTKGYDVSAVLETLKDMQFETPAVDRALKTQSYLYEGSRDFLEQLFFDLRSMGWQGRITSRSGVNMDGRVTAASLQSITLTLPYGTRTVELEQISPQTLWEMAQSFIVNVQDSTDYYRRQELCAIFAHQQGLREEPYRSQTQELMQEHRGFASRWLQVLQGG
jgi:eukaryotic-like serine/threonine-protein kinase